MRCARCRTTWMRSAAASSRRRPRASPRSCNGRSGPTCRRW
ncbi:hypothetical protein [Nannocystis pusilla]